MNFHAINCPAGQAVFEPRYESTELVHIDEKNPGRQIALGSPIREDLNRSLKSNILTFALLTKDMKGIDPSITNHELNVDPMYKPLEQENQTLIDQNHYKSVITPYIVHFTFRVKKENPFYELVSVCF